MRITIERLRAGALTGAGLLLVVLAVLLGVAHRRAHRLLHDLPGRLGADVQKETNGFTWSQTVKGKTIFTLHAARATQRKDGVAALHDVGIVMYGAKGDRADRIYGKDFDYDQGKGEVRAMGQVQLDLAAAPAAGTEGHPARPTAGTMPVPDHRPLGDESQPVHITTSGLVYQQKQGAAATDQKIHFEYRGMVGDARGAEFNSNTGVTIFQSEVHIAGLRDGRPAVLTASHAEMNRNTQTLTLQTAHYVSVATREHGAPALRQEIAAPEMLIHFGHDDQLQSIEGRGGVTVADETGTMHAQRGTVQMDAGGRPASARMVGQVTFNTSSPEPSPGEGSAAPRTNEGSANEGTVTFDAKGRVERVGLSGSAAFATHSISGDRHMQGQTVDLRFAPGTAGRPLLRLATAADGARVQITTKGNPAGRNDSTEELRGDKLVAKTEERNGVAEVSVVTGEGHTVLQRTADGVIETSRGATLVANFAPEVGGGRTKVGKPGTSQLVSAVQGGGIHFERTAAARGTRSAETMQGTANEASFDDRTQKLTLTGRVEIVEPGDVLRADRLVLLRGSGDAEATGAVQATYRQQAAPGAQGEASSQEAEPLHVVGARALLQRSAGTATFFGSAAGKARLWQGASQVEAPLLTFSQKDGVLDASGAAGDAALRPVATVLAGKSDAREGNGPGRQTTGVTRIASGRLHYANATRQAEFRDGVRLEDGNGTLSCLQAIATLQPQSSKEAGTPVPAARAAVPSLGGGVQRVVASGKVEIRQPGRRATGERALYTADDGYVTLTGTASSPPQVADDINGTVSGGSLRFHAGDNSVTVDVHSLESGNASGDGRVHTRTRMKQAR